MEPSSQTLTQGWPNKRGPYHVDVEVLVAEIALAEEVEDPHAANTIAENRPMDVSQLDFKAREFKSALL